MNEWRQVCWLRTSYTPQPNAVWRSDLDALMDILLTRVVESQAQIKVNCEFVRVCGLRMKIKNANYPSFHCVFMSLQYVVLRAPQFVYGT